MSKQKVRCSLSIVVVVVVVSLRVGDHSSNDANGMGKQSDHDVSLIVIIVVDHHSRGTYRY